MSVTSAALPGGRSTSSSPSATTSPPATDRTLPATTATLHSAGAVGPSSGTPELLLLSVPLLVVLRSS